MAEMVDARGLSCPQPVLMTLTKIKEMSTGEIEVVVDNEVSRENAVIGRGNFALRQRIRGQTSPRLSQFVLFPLALLHIDNMTIIPI